MFDQSAQVNFAQIDFENFDDNVRSYDNYSIFDFSITFSDKTTSSTSTILMNDVLNNSTNHSIHVEIVDLSMRSHVNDVNAVDALYDEKSETNKRSHVEKSIESRKSASSQFERLTSNFSLFNQQLFTQSIIDQQYQFQIAADLKSKKNKKNQEKKKFESQSIIDMLDDASNKYDSIIFIRQIFQNNKIDLI